MDIKKWRKKKGWSLDRLAKEVGVTRLTIIRWERGENAPHPNHIEKLKRIIVE